MSERLNLTGKIFGKLTVISFHSIKGKKGQQYTMWNCKCACGNIKPISGTKLTTGWTTSCSCIRSERIGNLNKSHQSCFTRPYRIWAGMKQRCNNSSKPCYKNYGGRGIKICKRWLKFENFRDDMSESYLKHIKQFGEKQTTLDRTNNDGNYCKENCRWATYREQRLNSRKPKK